MSLLFREPTKNYTNTLRITVFSLMFISMAIISIYFIVHFYRVSLDEAASTNSLATKSYTSNINNDLVRQLVEFENLAKMATIYDLPTELSYTQAAIELLQELVESTHLESAFVLDTKGGIQEVYPVEGYHFTDEFEGITQTIRSSEQPLFENYADQASLRQFFAKSSKDSYLLQAVPMYTVSNSLTEPLVFSGVLVAFISIEQLMQSAVDFQALKQGSYLEVIIDDQVLFDSRWLLKEQDLEGYGLGQDDFIATELAVMSPFKGKESIFSLRFSEPEYLYTSAVVESIQRISLMIIFLMVMVLIILNRYLKSLNQPLNQLLQICRDISSSNYKINPQGQVFTEFETIESALIRLAHQVESQIQTLVEAKEQAEQGEKTKAQFVANISHEIRTPMNGIIGYIQVLEQSELQPDAKQQVVAIKHACLQLLNILNDVLDLSKLDEEAIEISNEDFSLRDMFTNIYDIFLPSFEQKGVAFDIAFSDTVPDFVSADELRIRQVVSNITSNALKFTEFGHVTIELDYDKSKSSLEIVVTDTGIGIKEEYLEKLFIPFSQEDGHVARKYGGTGLGLNISKKLLDLMQGSIQVKSKPGEGATFVVHIPITETTAPVIEVPARKSSTPDLSSTSILIAEDNITNQMVIKALLKPTKAQLTMANNGEEAIEKIRESSFDIVLMDVQMPVLDGLSSTRILREEMDFEKPIIGVSANALQHDLDEAIDAGMSDYISKPIIKEELYKTLEKWCCVGEVG